MATPNETFSSSPSPFIDMVHLICFPKTVFLRNLFAIKERKSAVIVDVFLKLPASLQVEMI
jgi:hypothetical protein